jgi:hypothetical protein
MGTSLAVLVLVLMGLNVVGAFGFFRDRRHHVLGDPPVIGTVRQRPRLATPPCARGLFRS